MLITPLYAAILGIVEGLTEFLPISSTGHMILTSHFLGLPDGDPGLEAFEVVIQAGALLAVFGIYLRSIRSMALGVIARDRAGLKLLAQLFVAFLPAAIVGLLGANWIKAHLFGAEPVIIALAVGGILMIVVERWRTLRNANCPEPQSAGRPLSEMTLKFAMIVGCAQVVAMWPGTSRSMITMVAALLLGFSPKAAAEFSFLLALPTLGAATAHDFMKHGHEIIQASGIIGLGIGFFTSFVVAWIAVKSFLAYLTHHGMQLFGWYRLALAAVVAFFLLR